MIGTIRSGVAGCFGALPRFVPLTALLLSLPAVFIHAVPGAARLLEYDRASIASGEWWRLITGHWTHWSLDHLTWDLAAFGLLVLLGWSIHPRRAAAVLGLSTVAIPVAVWTFLPEMAHYRGLSGLDSALFVFVAVTLFREERAAGGRLMTAALALVVIGFLGKVAFEIVTGQTLFADSAAFVPVPLSHLIGGACGLLGAGSGKRTD